MEHLAKGENLYVVLGVPKTATADEIKKAYYKSALSVHPDRCTSETSAEEKATATKKFQKLGFVYSVLSDEKKRKVYDETGDIEAVGREDLNEDTVNWWKQYFERIFKPVTEEVLLFFMARKNI